MLERAERVQLVDRVVTEIDDVAPEGLETALVILRALKEAGGELPIEGWLDAQRAANVSEIVHRISRLASGQSTSNVAHATTDDERAARIAELRARLTQHDDVPTGDDTTQ
jgi:hypothetical protein